jgi:hypothetical protein
LISLGALIVPLGNDPMMAVEAVEAGGITCCRTDEFEKKYLDLDREFSSANQLPHF